MTRSANVSNVGGSWYRYSTNDALGNWEVKLNHANGWFYARLYSPELNLLDPALPVDVTLTVGDQLGGDDVALHHNSSVVVVIVDF